MRGIVVSTLAATVFVATVIAVVALAQQRHGSEPAGADRSVVSASPDCGTDVQQRVGAKPAPGPVADQRYTLGYDRSKLPRIRQAIQLRLLEQNGSDPADEKLVQGI